MFEFGLSQTLGMHFWGYQNHFAEENPFFFGHSQGWQCLVNLVRPSARRLPIKVHP